MKTKQIIIDGLTFNYSINENGHVVNTVTNRVLKPNTINNGYQTVTLTTLGVRKQMYIHKLMMLSFYPEMNEKCINHKDGDKTNNSLSNLEWCTYKQNIAHAFNTNLMSTKGRGKKRPIFIIAEEGKYYCESICAAARHLNVNQIAIHNYLRGFQQTVKGLKLELA